MRRASLYALAVVIAGIAAGSSACDDAPSGTVCTLIGCEDGLRVEIEGGLALPYTVSASVPGASHPWVVECTVAAPCDGSVWFPEFTPDFVRITVETESETRTRDVQVDYESFRPNGPECPPECLQGTVTFEL